MNYKDSENILLIICGAISIAALALIFRYLFIAKWGFDAFGANFVFIIIFAVGLVFFISYLEVIPPFFKSRKPIIENQDIALFLKAVFTKNLKDVDTDTIRKKLTFREGKLHIKLEKKL